MSRTTKAAVGLSGDILPAARNTFDIKRSAFFIARLESFKGVHSSIDR